MRWLLFVLSTGAAVVSSQLTVTSVAASSDVRCLRAFSWCVAQAPEWSVFSFRRSRAYSCLIKLSGVLVILGRW